ncbi:MAG: DNA polymerase III subunit alpha [Verrucomicrobiota bacterium]|nr:DNA polymerase III subunit alpha [Verrucomicrobiota bacterium]
MARVRSTDGEGAGEWAWAPLHLHSCYSFLESCIRLEDLVEFAVDEGLPAVALTDRNGLYGAVPFYKLARARGVRPILGAELDLEAGGRVVLLAADGAGYANLCRLISQRRFMGLDPETGLQSDAGRLAPRFTDAQLTEQSAGLFCLSGHRQGPLARRLAERDWEGARVAAERLAGIYPGRFFLELFLHSPGDAAILRRMRALGEELGLPCVVTPDAHYLTPADRSLYQVMASIRTLTSLRQAHPEKHLGGWFDLPRRDVLARRFPGERVAVANSLAVAMECDVELKLGEPIFPEFSFLDGRSPEGMLRALARAGLSRRYRTPTAEAQARMERELDVVCSLGYAEYFLIVWDIVQEARRRGICTTGRGSAADSLVCYLLGITDVCPMRHRLTFERFLNPLRLKTTGMVDIDLDIQWNRRDELLDFVYGRYGADNVAIIGSFSTYNARSAFADIGKVFGLPEREVRHHSKQLPHTAAAQIRSAGSRLVESEQIPMDRPPFDRMLPFVERIDQLPNHLGMHPCGVVIGRGGIEHMLPLERSAKGCVVTQYDMHGVEALGLVKMDLLGLAGLSVIPDTVTLARRANPRLQLEVGDLDRISQHDPHAWALIRRGDARGCFQIESPAMCSLLKMLGCKDLEALVAAVSVIRPGAANEGKKTEFARRYQGLEPVCYPHPSLSGVLGDTYGLMVYEEHVLTVAHSFAGMDLGRADLLRRAMVKHRGRDAFLGFEEEFRSGALAQGRAEEEIDRIWALLYDFCGYAFNKAHSASYARLAYQCAWLRSRFPAEFFAAVLSSRRGFYSQLTYVLDARNHGIGVLGPDVNESEAVFTTERGRIRVPLAQVSGIGQESVRTLLAARARGGRFGSLAELLGRVTIPREDWIRLARVGALDALGPSRSQILCSLEVILWERAQQCSAELFSYDELDRFRRRVEHVRPWTLRQSAEAEMELLGFPVSMHPVDYFAEAVEWTQYCPIAELERYPRCEVTVCGLQVAARHTTTMVGKRPGRLMKFISLADKTGILETVLFPGVYQRFGRLTARSPILAVTGVVEPFESGVGVNLRVRRVDAFPSRVEGVWGVNV